jgi:hypothetical protein
MAFDDFDSEEIPVAAPPRRELLVESLKLLTPALGLLLFLLGLTSKYPWLTQPWIKDILVVLGILAVVVCKAPRRYALPSNDCAKRSKLRPLSLDQPLCVPRRVSGFQVFKTREPQN